jgi:hypothetical protein
MAKGWRMREVISRRQVLRALGLPAVGIAAVAAALPGPRPALAFSLEQAADDVDGLYARAKACASGETSYHQQLVAEVKAMLAERNASVSDEEIRLAVALTTCPLCGCRLDA